MKLWKEDLVSIFKFTEGTFDIGYQSKEMACFHSLRGKLEPPDLTSDPFIPPKNSSCLSNLNPILHGMFGTKFEDFAHKSRKKWHNSAKFGYFLSRSATMGPGSRIRSRSREIHGSQAPMDDTAKGGLTQF